MCPLAVRVKKWGGGAVGSRTYWWSVLLLEACSPSRGSQQRPWSGRWPPGTALRLPQSCSCWRAAAARALQAGWRGSRPRGNRSRHSRGVSTWWWSSRLSLPQTAGPGEGELYLIDESQLVIHHACWRLFLKSQFPELSEATHRASHSRARLGFICSPENMLLCLFSWFSHTAYDIWHLKVLFKIRRWADDVLTYEVSNWRV